MLLKISHTHPRLWLGCNTSILNYTGWRPGQEGSIGYCWNISLFEQQLMGKVTIMLYFQAQGLF